MIVTSRRQPSILSIGLEIKSNSNLCIVSGYTRDNSSWVKLGEMTDKVNSEYAQKWNYGFRSYQEGFDRTRPASWSKLLFIKDTLKTYEWVFWVDSDAAITNHKIDIKQYCKDKEFVIGLDYEGLNCGVFLLKQGKFADWFIDMVWKSNAYINHNNWEQGAVRELHARDMLKDHIEVLKYKVINSFHRDTTQGKYELGDFICHMSGMFDMDARINGLRFVLENCKDKGLI